MILVFCVSQLLLHLYHPHKRASSFIVNITQ
jgi:hypothetical protein